MIDLGEKSHDEEALFLDATNGHVDKEDIFHCCVWQETSPGNWRFGLRVRGIVRMPYYAAVNGNLYWTIDNDAPWNAAESLHDAITSAEKALKEKWGIIPAP